jgi:hypothetical protein
MWWLSAAATYAATSRPSPTAGTSAPSLCAIVTDAPRQEGRTVTVRGTYYGGLEVSMLTCVSCDQADRTWVEFAPGVMPDVLAVGWPSFKPAVVANMTVVGTLRSKGGHFGHMGVYKHRLDVSQVVLVDVLRRLEEETPDMDAKVCR